jgi:predicted lactoylglutathione lyase
MIFVNLPVKDLKRSMEFFRGLGFEFNEQFTNDEAAFMVVNDGAAVMLVTDPLFSTFSSSKSIADTSKHYEVSNAISLGSREEVDAIGEKALATGGKPSKPPSDEGFMYSRSFLDPDGHLWDVHWMDPSAIGG